MSKIKIMHLLCMSTYSGAENVAITLINSLKDKVDSVYVSPDGSIRKVVQQNDIMHYAIEKVDVKNIRRAIKDIKPDIIHAHDFTAGTVCSLATRNIPIINHLHNNPPWIKRFSGKTIIYVLSCFRYKKILTVSDSVMDEFLFGKFFEKKTTVIGNPINLSVIKSKAEVAIQNEKFDVLFLGRLMPQKNPLLFVEVIADLVKKIPTIKVAIVGEGDLRHEVEKKIVQYDISKNVKMYGFQENPYGFVKNTKLLCIPSVWEGFGLVAVEGLCFGKPIIATPVGGLKDIVNDECGKLCMNKEEFVSEIYKLLTNYSYLDKKSKGALRRALNYDNIDDYSKMIMNVYKMITGEI